MCDIINVIQLYDFFLGGSFAKKMNNMIRKLDGANMDIDLVTPEDQIAWEQDSCPWKMAENVSTHKCAEKNISICPYFCGIYYQDYVLCWYPNENSLQGTK